MTFFDAIDQRRLRVEAVEDSGAVWPDVAANRWLHPPPGSWRPEHGG